MPAEEYVAMASDTHVLGDPLLKTQHFIGASKWKKMSDTEAMGWHQMRVPHQRYKDDTMQEVTIKGHAHGSNQHWYRKVDGKWKFAGLAVEIRWGEFEFEKVFACGEEKFGDSKENNTLLIADKCSQIHQSQDVEDGEVMKNVCPVDVREILQDVHTKDV